MSKRIGKRDADDPLVRRMSLWLAGFVVLLAVLFGAAAIFVAMMVWLGAL